MSYAPRGGRVYDSEGRIRCNHCGEFKFPKLMAPDRASKRRLDGCQTICRVCNNKRIRYSDREKRSGENRARLRAQRRLATEYPTRYAELIKEEIEKLAGEERVGTVRVDFVEYGIYELDEQATG